MNVKVFVLGRPGSGKSTAARYINRHFQKQGFSTSHINDYDILQKMFYADIDHKQFRPTAHNGFDAIDPSVLDVALLEVENQVRACTTDLVTIEFARDDYQRAFAQFSRGFLRDAAILFMDADIETCLRRVHERVAHASCHDDHPSYSDVIFRRYYQQDNRPYIMGLLREQFNLRAAIGIIDNTGSLKKCLSQVDRFVGSIMRDKVALPACIE